MIVVTFTAHRGVAYPRSALASPELRILPYYFCRDDIFVYSVDESFIDVTPYLTLYKKTPRDIATFMLKEICKRLGLPATCGIGTNLYLAKIALDIMAKHAPDRIGELTEKTFKETLWHHRPLTDFWRIGPGTQRTLHNMGIFDMARVAACPFPKLRKKFGIDACILYDHAYGREPTTIAEIKAYKPKTKSVSNGQVLLRDYSYAEALTILKEMADQLALELVEREVITESVTMYIGYSMRPGIVIPASGGTARFPEPTSSSTNIARALVKLYHHTPEPFLRVFAIYELSIPCASSARSDKPATGYKDLLSHPV